eukprot:1159385-Pyramimonas_sp.AAC.2
MGPQVGMQPERRGRGGHLSRASMATNLAALAVGRCFADVVRNDAILAPSFNSADDSAGCDGSTRVARMPLATL